MTHPYDIRTFLVQCTAMLSTSMVACASDTFTQSPQSDAAASEDANEVSLVPDIAVDAQEEPDGFIADIVDVDAIPDTPEPEPPWDPGFVDTEALGQVRDWSFGRGLIHVHSVHSHDACDGMPRLDNGEPNEDCLRDFREGICTTRQDVVFLTEHEETAAEVEFEALLLRRDDDVLVYEGDSPVANAMACPDGHRSILLAGGEFDVMPVGLDAHIPGDIDFRQEFYNNVGPGRVSRMKNELGAVVLQAHTESKTVDDLRRLDLDGFEIYNLHANIDPTIREEHLGLDAWGFTEGLEAFLRDDGPHPDLTLLGFLSPNVPALETFDTLLSENRHLVGTGGIDAHRNVLPLVLRDGERVDSYRRMMRFVTHHFLVSEKTPTAFEDALRIGRFHVVFETFGTPVGLDFRAEYDGEVTEMGQDARRSATIHVALPSVYGHEATEVPIHIKLIRAENAGGVTVAETMNSDLSYTADERGAYRAEISLTPTHLTPWLGSDPTPFLVPTLWVYSNPIYID